jgi:hypothetical protein
MTNQKRFFFEVCDYTSIEYEMFFSTFNKHSEFGNYSAIQMNFVLIITSRGF